MTMLATSTLAFVEASTATAAATRWQPVGSHDCTLPYSKMSTLSSRGKTRAFSKALAWSHCSSVGSVSPQLEHVSRPGRAVRSVYGYRSTHIRCARFVTASFARQPESYKQLPVMLFRAIHCSHVRPHSAARTGASPCASHLPLAGRETSRDQRTGVGEWLHRRYWTPAEMSRMMQSGAARHTCSYPVDAIIARQA